MWIKEIMRGGKRGWRIGVERDGKITMPFSMAISLKKSRNTGITSRLIWK
jgi:hypothetical protein